MNTCKQIHKELKELFDCSELDEYIRIETPFLYPDGDIIDLFYKENSLDRVISDLGGVSDWLGLQTISKSRTEKQDQQIEYICESYRVEFREGEFFIDLSKGNETRNLTDAIFDLGQAIIRISGLWFLQIDKARNQIISSIEAFMEDTNIKFEKNKPFEGSSGTIWKPNFYTENKSTRFLIYVLSTEKKASTANILYRINAAWDDLSYLKFKQNNDLRFMSLFDDRYNVWKASQRNLLKKNSIIKNFSNRTDLRNTLIGIV